MWNQWHGRRTLSAGLSYQIQKLRLFLVLHCYAQSALGWTSIHQFLAEHQPLGLAARLQVDPENEHYVLYACTSQGVINAAVELAVRNIAQALDRADYSSLAQPFGSSNTRAASLKILVPPALFIVKDPLGIMSYHLPLVCV